MNAQHVVNDKKMSILNRLISINTLTMPESPIKEVPPEDPFLEFLSINEGLTEEVCQVLPPEQDDYKRSFRMALIDIYNSNQIHEQKIKVSKPDEKDIVEKIRSPLCFGGKSLSKYIW